MSDARGQAILAQLNLYRVKREEKILINLVSLCENGTMTSDQMRDGIAGIAALRALSRDIERDVKRALSERAETMTA